MLLEKQDDGVWVLKNSKGEVLGTIDDQYGEWLVRSNGWTVGICHSRKTAETLLRTYLGGEALQTMPRPQDH